MTTWQKINDNQGTLNQDRDHNGNQNCKKATTLKSSLTPPWKINRHLLLSKMIYFIYSLAIGGLRPFLPIYFKQIGITAKQLGLIMGCRPLVEALSAVTFSHLADRFQCHKLILIMTLSIGGLLTFTFNFIPIPQIYCLPDNSTSDIVINRTFTSTLFHSSPMYTMQNPYTPINDSYSIDYSFRRYGSAFIDNPTYIIDRNDLYENFICILVLIVISELITAPSLTLVDTYTLYQLGDKKVEYGRQRCWAAVGTGVGELISGLILIHSIMTIEFCGQIYMMGHNYKIAYIMYLMLMNIAAVIAYQLQFADSNTVQSSHAADHQHDKEADDSDIFDEDHQGMETKKLIRHYYHLYRNRLQTMNAELSESEIEDDSDDTILNYSTDSNDEMGQLAKSAAQKAALQDKYATIYQMFTSLRYGSALWISLCFGTANGILSSFMYWHLQSLGGTTFLFGCIGVTIHLMETITFFFTQYAIKYLSHAGVMSICILFMAVVCMSLAFLQMVWLAIPIGAIIGMISALFFASGTSFFSQASPQHRISSAQGIFQAVYCGLGCSIGSILGGFIITHSNANNLFFIAGIFYVTALLIFMLLQLIIYLSQQDTGKCNGWKSRQSVGCPTQVNLFRSKSY